MCKFVTVIFFAILFSSPDKAEASSCLRIVLNTVKVYGPISTGIEVTGNVYQTCLQFTPIDKKTYLPKYTLDPHQINCVGPSLRIGKSFRMPEDFLGVISCRGTTTEFGVKQAYVRAYIPYESFPISRSISHSIIGATQKSSTPTPVSTPTPTPTATIKPAATPTPTPTPTLLGVLGLGARGVAEVGNTISLAWQRPITDYDTVTYQWVRTKFTGVTGSDIEIPGANQSSYTIQNADSGWGIYCQVVFKKNGFKDYLSRYTISYGIPTPTPTRLQ